ncbi:MAG: hypothetical protein R3293_11065 [Candidatus Promineifilaceae bacterium]|nr:hypothetical protein [Candidatus Promineifilaceae bacterium]
MYEEIIDAESHYPAEPGAGCFSPEIAGDPADPNLYPIDPEKEDEEPPSLEYQDGHIKGLVYFPYFFRSWSTRARAPIVVMAHGNHNPADPSYRGYKYFQIQLARIGIIAVSVDCNALNGRAGGVKNIEDRADLIIDNIKYFQGLDQDPNSVFFEKIDFTNLGLMGHSRGGDAVVMIPEVPIQDVIIKAVLALAPTNFRYWDGLPTIRPQGYAFMTILPAADGDVWANNGAQFYDQAIPGPYKSQVYAHNANHNFFNREWLHDDSISAMPHGPLFSRYDHECILSAFGCALFRTSLLGENLTDFISGSMLAASVQNRSIFLSFEKDEALTVDNHEDNNAIDINSLGHPTSQIDGMVAGEYEFERVPGAYNSSFYGQSVGMVAEKGPQNRIFRTQLPAPSDLIEKDVWIRAAEVTDGKSVPVGATGFQLGLEDVNGNRSWVDSNDIGGGLPRPYQRKPGTIKTMLNTLYFKSDCFEQKMGPDLKNVQAILVRCNRNDDREFAFDDLQIVERRYQS